VTATKGGVSVAASNLIAAISGDRQVHGHPHAAERAAQHHPFAMQIDNAQTFVRGVVGSRKTRGQ
jgi:hypothetical protein